MKMKVWRLIAALVWSCQALACHATLSFDCPGTDLNGLAKSLGQYFQSLGVSPDAYTAHLDVSNATLQIVYVDLIHGTDTLGLIHQVGLDLREELIQMPSEGSKPRTVVTVSKKEILLALLQSGRISELLGAKATELPVTVWQSPSFLTNNP
jgi:hypothetical protein